MKEFVCRFFDDVHSDKCEFIPPYSFDGGRVGLRAKKEGIYEHM